MRGYSWALHELKARTITPDGIDKLCDQPFEGRTPFDDGALQAVEDMLNYGIKDDRWFVL